MTGCTGCEEGYVYATRLAPDLTTGELTRRLVETTPCPRCNPVAYRLWNVGHWGCTKRSSKRGCQTCADAIAGTTAEFRPPPERFA